MQSTPSANGHKTDLVATLIIPPGAPDQRYQTATKAEPLPDRDDDIAIGYVSDRREIQCSLASCRLHISPESEGRWHLSANATTWPASDDTDGYRWVPTRDGDEPREVDEVLEPREPVIDTDPERLTLEQYISAQMIAYRCHNSEAADLVADHLAELLSDVRALGSPRTVTEFSDRLALSMGYRDDRDLGACDPADDLPDEFYRYNGHCS